MSFGPLVDPAWLLANLGEPGLAIVDCRWRLGDPGAGEPLYRTAHIPGAAFLDLDRDLAAPPSPAEGRHPLPDAARFAAAAGRAGIGDGVRVVAYDEGGESGAARLWWLLRHFGHADVAVLDGGLRAWRAAGGSLARGEEDAAHRPPPARFEPRPRAGDTAGADEIERRLGDPRLALVDARAPARYRGDEEPIDPVAGHIPGAGNAPVAELAPDGRFRPPDELRARLVAAGAEAGGDLVVYCGSGVSACTAALAAEIAGLEARLFPGSWSAWAAGGRRVETGDRGR